MRSIKFVQHNNEYDSYYSFSDMDDGFGHYNVKGSHWGDRKYQYKDGSLTPLGRIHYGVGKARDASAKVLGKAKRAIKSFDDKMTEDMKDVDRVVDKVSDKMANIFDENRRAENKAKKQAEKDKVKQLVKSTEDKEIAQFRKNSEDFYDMIMKDPTVDQWYKDSLGKREDYVEKDVKFQTDFRDIQKLYDPDQKLSDWKGRRDDGKMWEYEGKHFENFNDIVEYKNGGTDYSLETTDKNVIALRKHDEDFKKRLDERTKYREALDEVSDWDTKTTKERKSKDKNYAGPDQNELDRFGKVIENPEKYYDLETKKWKDGDKTFNSFDDFMNNKVKKKEQNDIVEGGPSREYIEARKDRINRLAEPATDVKPRTGYGEYDSVKKMFGLDRKDLAIYDGDVVRKDGEPFVYEVNGKKYNCLSYNDVLSVKYRYMNKEELYYEGNISEKTLNKYKRIESLDKSGLSVKEIAKRLGIPEGTVSSYLYGESID